MACAVCYIFIIFSPLFICRFWEICVVGDFCLCLYFFHDSHDWISLSLLSFLLLLLLLVLCIIITISIIIDLFSWIIIFIIMITVIKYLLSVLLLLSFYISSTSTIIIIRITIMIFNISNISDSSNKDDSTVCSLLCKSIHSWWWKVLAPDEMFQHTTSTLFSLISGLVCFDESPSSLPGLSIFHSQIPSLESFSFTLSPQLCVTSSRNRLLLIFPFPVLSSFILPHFHSLCLFLRSIVHSIMSFSKLLTLSFPTLLLFFLLSIPRCRSSQLSYCLFIYLFMFPIHFTDPFFFIF